MATRLEHLRVMVEGAEERMLSGTCSDQNFAVLGRMRAEFLREIDELDPPKSEGAKTGLTEFERKLRERESGAKASRRAKSS